MKIKAASIIKQYLEENGIKQEYVTKKTGIPANTLSDILNLKRKLLADELISIVLALGIDANYVVERINGRVQPQSEEG